MASFVSSKELEEARAEKRRARQKLLKEEEDRFLAKQEAKRRHKESGNDRWILPGIERRLESEASKLSEVSFGKKSKKTKKKKRKKASSSESSDSESETIWEEKAAPSEESTSKVVKTEQTNWFNFDDVISGKNTFTSKSIKEQKEAEKAASGENEDEKIGQHPKELNPYWKGGGTGLPTEQSTNTGGTSKVHKEWLLRSLKRMTEQAKEQGKTVESIAAERYGSWQEFQSLLRQAEPHRDTSRHRYRSDRREKSDKFLIPRDDDDDESYSRHSHRERDRRDSRKKLKNDRHPAWKKTRDNSPRSNRRERRYEGGIRSPERSDSTSWKKRRSEQDDKQVRMRNQNPTDHRNKSSGKETKSELLKSSSKSSERNDSSNTNNQATPPRILGPKRPLSDQASELLPRLPVPSSTGSNDSDTVPLNFENSSNASSSEPVNIKPIFLTEKEKNQLAAKILKAELMGNEKLAKTLKAKLENAKAAESAAAQTAPKLEVASKSAESQRQSGSSSEEETVVLTRVGKDGQSWPLQHSEMAYDSLPNRKRKKTKLPTHDKEGKRERYFADDDRHSLEDLVRREKTQEAEDQHAMFSRLASKQFQGTDSEYFTLDDMYVSEASRKNTRTEEEARQKQRAISEHKKLAIRLEKCKLCFGNPELPKHLLIAIGKKAYLALPDHKPLTEGHCVIAPMHHCATGTSLDEDVWAEVRHFMRSLQTMFKSIEKDCVFMQTCIALKKSRHFFVDCIPLPREEGDMAPIYFKKAIQESESEWSHNKKLIDTRGKDLQKCVPKGLPYFSVEFGMDGGFAHVVEDEALFPIYFGREVVGGMLDVEPRLWRHPPQDHFSEQTKRSVRFSEWWKPYDWTAGISGTS